MRVEEFTTALAEAERQYGAKVARIGSLRAAAAHDLAAVNEDIDEAVNAQLDAA